MNVAISLLISLLARVIPAVAANEALINDIISTLEQLVPFVVKEFKDLTPLVKNIIAALQDKDGVTQAQWDALDALESKLDAEFDSAAGDEGV